MKLTDDEIIKLKNERYRADQAQQVLDNSAFRDAIATVRQRYIDAWLKAPLNDKEGQHYIRVLLAAHDSIVSQLEQTMRSGQMAEISLTKNPFRDSRSRRKGAKDEE